jgi:hypothetical protein
MDPNEQALFDYLGRHFVAISAVYLPIDALGAPTGKPKSATFSGFAVVLDGSWYVITAGHVLGEEFGTLIKKRKIRLEHCSLADFFGKDAISTDLPTPISFESHPQHYKDEEGYLGQDFGALKLRDFYVSGLGSNGVLPIIGLKALR